MKELRYHPRYNEMIISTSLDGFNVFKPALDDEEEANREKEEEEEENDKGKIKVIKESELNDYLARLSLNN